MVDLYSKRTWSLRADADDAIMFDNLSLRACLLEQGWSFVFILRLLSHEERRKEGEEKKEDTCSIKKDLTDDDAGFVTPATGTCTRQNIMLAMRA